MSSTFFSGFHPTEASTGAKGSASFVVGQGPAGLNNAIVYLYQRAATTPAAPTGTFTYTFATGVLSGGTPGNWTQAIPANNGNPLWVIAATASANTATDTIAAAEFSSPVILSQDGGAGINSATVFLYRRSASAPPVPSTPSTYTFATGVLTGQNNSWTQAVPTNDGNPLYVTTATAAATTPTDTITAAEWSTPSILAQNGEPGAAGLNSAPVFIYQRAATAPAAPSANATYTFATGGLTGLNNGWSATILGTTGGNPLWVRQASASGTGATDVIAPGEWSAAQQLAIDGTPGAAGGNTAVVFLYARAATAPVAPTGSTTYTFATGVLSGTPGNGWTQNIPAANGQPLWVRTAVAFAAAATDTIAAGEWSGAQRLAEDGTPGLNGIDGAPGGNFILDPIFGDGWVYSNAGYSPGASGANIYDRHRATFFGEGVIWFVGSGFPALERAPVQQGQTYYLSLWLNRLSSATGHVSGRVELFDATGTNIGVEDVPGVTTIGGPNDVWYMLQGQWTCPAGVAYVRPLVGNNTGGNSSTIFVAMPHFGSQQPGADVSAFPSGPTSSVFKHSAEGVAEAGEFPRNLTYQFNNLSGPLLSGVTWQYRVTSGTVNGNASSSTWHSMTGTGSGVLPVNSLGADNNEVIVRGTSSAQVVEMRVSLAKSFAAPNNTGGGGGTVAIASQSSGFTTFSGTTFVSISNELQVTSGTTTQTAKVNLTMRSAGKNFLGVVELQIERWNGSAWVSFGAAVQRTIEKEYDPENQTFDVDNPAVFSFNQTIAITAGTNQRIRARARRVSGTSGTISTTGSLILEA